MLDTETEEVTTFRARVTMLATGGCGQVYLHTTNPEIATGDGVAMAYRAGADIANMEFIQFHPTSLYHPDARSFLISEAVRGEGGILRLQGRQHLHGELPRDGLPRAEGHRRPRDRRRAEEERRRVRLPRRDAPRRRRRSRSRFPNIYEKCLSVGIDITKDWIPIVPAAHYSCGGVLTDVNARTSIERLYACGEVACTGVHGANRLASNSLLEAVVFAPPGGRRLEQYIGEVRLRRRRCLTSRSRRTRRTYRPEIIARTSKDGIRRVMWRYVGIVRTNERLRKAQDAVWPSSRAQVEKIYATGRLSPRAAGTAEHVTTAALIIESAIVPQGEPRAELQS